jgi:glycerol dehydrogenase-like iron-containing ADH family enzyme
MQEQINNLQQQIDELKNQLSNVGMPIELREIMRNEVVKDAITSTVGTTTTSYTITAVPQSIDVTTPTIPTLFLIIKWRGAEYKIPYYV